MELPNGFHRRCRFDRHRDGHLVQPFQDQQNSIRDWRNCNLLHLLHGHQGQHRDCYCYLDDPLSYWLDKRPKTKTSAAAAESTKRPARIEASRRTNETRRTRMQTTSSSRSHLLLHEMTMNNNSTTFWVIHLVTAPSLCVPLAFFLLLQNEA